MAATATPRLAMCQTPQPTAEVNAFYWPQLTLLTIPDTVIVTDVDWNTELKILDWKSTGIFAFRLCVVITFSFSSHRTWEPSRQVATFISPLVFYGLGTFAHCIETWKGAIHIWRLQKDLIFLPPSPFVWNLCTGLPDNMTPFGIEKSVVLTDCHIIRWFSQ